ncbi:hypothetical protein B0I33_103541 [Prauserella shujinwangii]|uniref:Uncharacterized protein n=1 Tax=Prauserella shujinwangii TaxID=1453103 RepID=A0A2T0LZG2_9PSEU|nr:hypothetical protein [Prauserella shujinwangii]PRX49504.1 hypothetical protein B0I33_103541 [Prauserella shujinwangii]
MRITGDDVRALLESDLPGSTLVVHEGRPTLLGGDDLGSDRYAGALVVVSRDDLRRQIGDRQLSERDFDELAAGLEAAVSNLGG